jgi:hypothetical protein
MTPLPIPLTTPPDTIMYLVMAGEASRGLDRWISWRRVKQKKSHEETQQNQSRDTGSQPPGSGRPDLAIDGGRYLYTSVDSVGTALSSSTQAVKAKVG